MNRPVLILFAALLLTGPQSDGQAPPGAAEEGGATTAEPAPAAAPGPERSGQRSEPLETFAPSEKLPADSAIAFPVDI